MNSIIVTHTVLTCKMVCDLKLFKYFFEDAILKISMKYISQIINGVESKKIIFNYVCFFLDLSRKNVFCIQI